MYELVKKRKTNIFLKIIIFLVACAIIKELLSFILGPAPVSEQLDKFVTETNKRCPMILDSTITLQNCSAHPGNRLNFNYKSALLLRTEVDTNEVKKATREDIINKVNTDPSLAPFKKEKISISATYYDKAGSYICAVTILPEEYTVTK